ncbi:MAG: hypothetical protein RLN62_01495 [Rickettsiales bacterium]
MMKTINSDFFDNKRNRKIPCAIYLPQEIKNGVNLVVFSPGYREQEKLKIKGPSYTNYSFLAEYFTNESYVFLSIQHDLLGDNDGLETIDPKVDQSKAREHLWKRGAENIKFCLQEVKKLHPEINIDKFIISGHSNGGDIAKYYANNNESKIDSIISLDGRRAPIKRGTNFKILMFEGSDTALDSNVVPGGQRPQPGDKQELEYILIKPKNVLHAQYCDDASEEVKNKIYQSIDFFLKNYGR